MQPVIDHVQITVRDLDAAVIFYDKLMPLLGFDPKRRNIGVVEAHEFRVVEYGHPRLCSAITAPRKAFASDAVHVGPGRSTTYTPAGHDALFFKDSDGIKHDVVTHRRAALVPGGTSG